MKRFLSILLSVLMVVSVLAIVASCSGQKTDTTTAATQVDTTAETTTAKQDDTTKQTTVETTTATEKVTTAETTTATEKVTTAETTTEAQVTTTESTTAKPVETTTLPVFARFDFGTDTYAEAEGLTSHEYLTSVLNYDDSCLMVNFEKDYWDVWTVAAYDASAPMTEAFGQKNMRFALIFNDIVTFDFDDEIVIGYGGYKNTPYQNVEDIEAPVWAGKHQYMQVRLVNKSSNNIWSIRFIKTGDGAYFTTCVMGNLYLQRGEPASSTDYRRTCTPTDEWATYTYDIFLTSGLASGRGQVAWKSNNAKCDNWFDYKAYVFEVGNPGGTNVVWSQDKSFTSLELNLFAGIYTYGSEGEQWDAAAEHIKEACDTRANNVSGMDVKIDYLIFGCSPEQLDAYKSTIEAAA